MSHSHSPIKILHKTYLSFMCLIFYITPVCFSATITWTKGADGNFGENSSWTGANLPGVSDEAVIDTAYSISSNLSLTIQNLTLNNGNLIIQGGDTLTVSENVFVTSPTRLSGFGNILTKNLYLTSGNLDLSEMTISESIEIYSGNISANLNGTGNLHKSTSDVAILSGINNYSGNTVITAGTIYASADNVLPASTDLILSSGTYSLNGFNQTIHSLSGQGNLDLANGDLVISHTENYTFSGNITGTGNITFNQSGTLTLDGKSGFSGQFNIDAGNLQFKNGGAGSATMNLNGGNMIGSAWRMSTQGLYYGTVNTRDDETTLNPNDSISTDLAGTDDNIATNTTEIWNGFIYDEDGHINLREHNDDESFYKLDDTIYLNNDQWNVATESGNLNISFNPALPTGWHEFEMRFSNGAGGSGPPSGHGFSVDWDGGTSFDHPMDNGYLDRFVYEIQSLPIIFNVLTSSSLDFSGIETGELHELNLSTGSVLSITGNLHLDQMNGSGNLSGNVSLYGDTIIEENQISTLFLSNLNLENGANLHLEFSSTSQDNLQVSDNISFNSTWNIHIDDRGLTNISAEEAYFFSSYNGSISGNMTDTVTFSTNSESLDVSTAYLINDTSSLPHKIYISGITDKIRWVAGTDSSWETAANWAGNEVPDSDKSVLLNTDHTISLNTSDSIYNYIQTIGELNIGSTENLHITNQLTIEGGTLSGLGNISAQDVLLTQGTITVNQLTVSNALTVLSGSISSNLYGNADFTKNSFNDLTLYNTSFLTGQTNILAGNLYLGSDNSISSVGNLFLTGGTVSMNGFNQTIASLSGAGNLDIGSGNLTLTSSEDMIFSGNLSGNGKIILNGSSSFTLTGSSDFTGTYVINQGSVDLTQVNTTASSIELSGGTFIGESWSFSTQGLWYGEIELNGDEDNPNPRTSISTDFSGTEDSINSNTTEVWTGYFYDSDGFINFQENNDDNSYYSIDGIEVLNDGTWNNVTNTGNLNLSHSTSLPPGWHEFEMRFGNGSGGAGPVSTHAFSVDWDGGTNFDHPMDTNTTDRFIYDLTANSLFFNVASSSNLIMTPLLSTTYHQLTQSTNTIVNVSGNLKLAHWSGIGHLNGNIHTNGNIILGNSITGVSNVNNLTIESGTNLQLGLGSIISDNLQIAGNLTLNGNLSLLIDDEGANSIDLNDEFVIITYVSNLSGNLTDTVSYDLVYSEYDLTNASLINRTSTNPKQVILTGVTDFFRWDAGSDGDWDNGINWVGDNTPTSNRSVKQDVDHTITLNSGNTAVLYILDQGTLNISATGNLDITDTFNLNGGTLTGLGNVETTNLSLFNGQLSISDLTVNNSLEVTRGHISSNIHGAVDLIKNGEETVSISSYGSTYTGNTTIHAGTLIAAGDFIFPDATTLFLEGGTFSTNGFDQTLSNIQGTGNLLITGGNLTIQSSEMIYFTGNLMGAGNLVIRGGGHLVFSGTNDFSGQLISAAGNLELVQLDTTWNQPVVLAGGNFKGGFLMPIASGLWSDTAAGSDNESAVNSMSNTTSTLLETENGISGSTTEIFTGYIYDPDHRLSFRASNDDTSYIKIDNDIVLNNNSATETTYTGALTLSANASLPPGWHDFDLRFGNGAGGSGPNNGHGFSVDWDGEENYDHPNDNGFMDRFTYSFIAQSGLQVEVISSSNIEFNYLNTPVEYSVSLYNDSSLAFSGTGNFINVFGAGTLMGNSVISGNVYPGGNSIGTLNVLDGLTISSGTNIIYGIGSSSSDKISVTGNLILNSTWTVSLNDDGAGIPNSENEYDIFTYTGTLTGNITTTGQINSLVPHWNIENMTFFHDTSSSPKRIYIKGESYVVPKPPLIRLPGAF